MSEVTSNLPSVCEAEVRQPARPPQPTREMMARCRAEPASFEPSMLKFKYILDSSIYVRPIHHLSEQFAMQGLKISGR
jgi:hypothetical protein